jgi:nicotinamidase/pyrazinamidase
MENHPDFYMVASQDWHPKDHGSFASTHKLQPFVDKGPLPGCPQLWPDHCVQGTFGAELAQGFNIEKIQYVVQKGLDPLVDSYSAFFDNNGLNPSPLHAHLQSQGITNLVLSGIATDYCVKFTALDAKNLGYDVTVLIDLCRGVDPETTKEAIQEMKDKGIRVMTTQEYEESLILKTIDTVFSAVTGQELASSAKES